jgi:ATP-dependent DNA ligase
MGLQPFCVLPLDERFVEAKPVQEAPDSLFLELEQNGDLYLQRKRNGHKTYSAVGTHGRAKLYSSGIADLSTRFPAVVDEVFSVNVPGDTLLASEIVAEVNGFDSFKTLNSIIKCKPEKAVERQKVNNPIRLVIYNVVLYKGQPVIHWSYEDRYDLVQNLFAEHQGPLVSVVDLIDMPFLEAEEHSVKANWEGLVGYDKKGGSTYHLYGDARPALRPPVCWKRKKYRSDDFVATGWRVSTAATKKGEFKDFVLEQYHPHTGAPVDCGFCGSGITKKQAKELMDLSLYPMVVEIEYETRTDNHKINQGTIMRIRDDKKPHECILPL